MRNKMIALTIVLFMSFGGAISGSAESQAVGKETSSATQSLSLRASLQQNHPVAWWMLNRLADKLQLTQPQREQIDAIIAAELPAMQPLVQQMIENRRQWRSSVQAADFNEEQSRAFAEQQSALMTELIIVKERMRAQVNTVLTEEQRNQIDEICNTVEERVREWFKQWNS